MSSGQLETARIRTTVVVLLTLLVAGGLMFAPGIVSAQEEEEQGSDLPAAYFGEVTVDGEPADGVEITAEVDGNSGSIVAEDGEYGGPGLLDEKLTVAGDEGAEVEFFVEGEEAETDPEDVEIEQGEDQRVDLAVDELPEEEEEEEDDDDDTATGGGGGGAAPADDDTDDVVDDADDAVDDVDEPEESIDDTRETVDQSEPDVDTEREIEDADPDTPGVTVDTSDETRTVESVTFTDEGTTGSVNVREYSDEAVVESTSNSLSSQLEQEIRSVGDVGDITVTDEDGEPAPDTAATVRMGVDADEVDNPDDVVINHETDEGWEQLETTLEEETDDRVRVSADVDGFSLFAVAEIAPAEEEPVDDEPIEEEPAADGIGTTGLIGLVVVIALVVAAAVAYRQMNAGDGDDGL